LIRYCTLQYNYISYLAIYLIRFDDQIEKGLDILILEDLDNNEESEEKESPEEIKKNSDISSRLETEINQIYF
ncbi:813_t:CDS:2, partial [Scutellospora calospora]